MPAAVGSSPRSPNASTIAPADNAVTARAPACRPPGDSAAEQAGAAIATVGGGIARPVDEAEAPPNMKSTPLIGQHARERSVPTRPKLLRLSQGHGPRDHAADRSEAPRASIPCVVAWLVHQRDQAPARAPATPARPPSTADGRQVTAAPAAGAATTRHRHRRIQAAGANGARLGARAGSARAREGTRSPPDGEEERRPHQSRPDERGLNPRRAPSGCGREDHAGVPAPPTATSPVSLARFGRASRVSGAVLARKPREHASSLREEGDRSAATRHPSVAIRAPRSTECDHRPNGREKDASTIRSIEVAGACPARRIIRAGSGCLPTRAAHPIPGSGVR